MQVSEFIDFMKEDFSSEKLENSDNHFFEYFFYYKRNIREFLSSFKSSGIDEQKQIITFLLHLYPLSDTFLKEIFREYRFSLTDEITVDTINYICSVFIEEVGEMNINFDTETQKNIDKINSIKDIVELNQVKMNRLIFTKKEFSQLKERDEKLSKDIKELENGNINALKDEIAIKQKRYDELKTEKNELSRQFDKVKHDLAELNRYSDLRDQVSRCREILKEVGLPKDYTDKLKLQDV